MDPDNLDGPPASSRSDRHKGWYSYKYIPHFDRPDIIQGRFWFPDYFDRYIRIEQHLANAIEYIHDNAVKAELVVERADQWPFSGARWLR